MWQTDGGVKQSTRRGGPSLTKDLQTEHELIQIKKHQKTHVSCETDVGYCCLLKKKVEQCPSGPPVFVTAYTK